MRSAFLPDKDREAAEARLREALKAEFLAAQEATKKEKLEIVYSYWDGTGHRRTITVPKGTTVGKFLEWVRQDLIEDFPEMRNVSGDQLLYVKVRAQGALGWGEWCGGRWPSLPSTSPPPRLRRRT